MIQHERIQTLCQGLYLITVAGEYPQLVQQASTEQQSYVDFLKQMLNRERMACHICSQGVLRRSIIYVY